MERRQLEYQTKTDENFEKVFAAIEEQQFVPKKGIFFDGQVFDAHKFVSDIVRSAKRSIVLIDNYIDESVLVLLSKKRKGVDVLICTRNISEQLSLDVKRFDSQYPSIAIRRFSRSHDRFLMIDDKKVYHIGASLKDLGKRWFGFSRFDKEGFSLLDELEQDKSEYKFLYRK
jgi:hypothetical protein